MSVPGRVEMSLANSFLHLPGQIKYTILAISICIFLLACGILAWQMYRYFTQMPRPLRFGNGFLHSPVTDTANEHFPSPAVKAHRLSSCPSQSSSLWEQSSSELHGLDEDPQEELRIQGSLRFTLLYEQTSSRLMVSLLEACQLPARRSGQTGAPRVHVCVLCKGPGAESAPTEPLCYVVREWQSRPVKDHISHTFREQFSCALAQEQVRRVTVRLEVKGFNTYSQHDTLGEVRVALDGLDLELPLEISRDLLPPQKDQVGEILLSLRYLPTSQRLEVGLLKMRTLSHSKNDNRALYAKTGVLCDHRKLRRQKTSTRPRRDVTAFNEVMCFSLPDSYVGQCSVTVCVYEVRAGRRSTRRVLGMASVRKGDAEDEHWAMMMSSLRQPVAKWHPLYI